MGELGRESGRGKAADRGTVLIVDDSRLVRVVVARHLKSSGFQVQEAEDGASAMKMLSGGTFDVVITDLRMPKLDGFGVLSAVKRLGLSTEVIILTGTHAQDMSSAVKALRLGAHDYLTKPPSSADEVIHTVDRAVEKKRLRETNQRLLRELETLSRTDVLTQLLNRRSLDESLSREIARSRRHQRPLSMIVFDIDHFKGINDAYGHPGGDDVLRGFAEAVKAAVRECDMMFRYGGEEFVAVLPETDLAGAMVVANRVVAAVAAAPMQAHGAHVRITTSAGVATLDASDADGDSLVARADAALYEAKKGGRNQARASRGRFAVLAGGRAS